MRWGVARAAMQAAAVLIRPMCMHSPAAKDLMRALLERDERHRLGSLRGALDIKEHPFFHGVRWQMLHHLRPRSSRTCRTARHELLPHPQR